MKFYKSFTLRLSEPEISMIYYISMKYYNFNIRYYHNTPSPNKRPATPPPKTITAAIDIQIIVHKRFLFICFLRPSEPNKNSLALSFNSFASS